MKFFEVFRFEFLHQLYRISTWLFFLILFILSSLLVHTSTPAEKVLLNAPVNIAFWIIIGNLMWILMAAVVAGKAASRDNRSGMQELMYTTPIKKIDYLGGRFLASFFLNIFIQLAIPLGITIAIYLLPVEENALLGPFRFEVYLNTFGIISLPIIFCVTAIQFSLASLTGRPMSSFLGSILVLISSQFISTSVAEILQSWKAAKLFDLIGLMSIGKELEAWTILEKNVRLIPLEGSLLLNRLLWIGLACIFLCVTYVHFHFTISKKIRGVLRKKSRKNTSSILYIEHEVHQYNNLSETKFHFNLQTYLRQMLDIAASSFRIIVHNKLWIIISIIYAVGVVFFSSEFIEFKGVALIPRTEKIIDFLTTSLSDMQTPLVIIPLLIIFYSGELIWREREIRINAVVDHTPVPDWVFFSGKFLGLTLVVVLWLFIVLVSGIFTQANLNYHHFQIELYLKAILGLQLINYILFILLALFVHVLLNNKYIAHLFLILIYGLIGFAPLLGIEHKLLIYCSDLGWDYSDFRGFEPYIWPWVLFKLYWISWALLIAIFACVFWIRSAEQKLSMRIKLANNRLSRMKLIIMFSVLGILCFGGCVFYQTNILNDYTTANDRVELRAKYEKLYGKYKNVTQPVLTGTSLKVDIKPAVQTVEIDGTYCLVNRASKEISFIHLATASEVVTENFQFNKPTEHIFKDNELGHHIFKLIQPLQPYDTLYLNYKVNYKRNSFRNHGVDASVVTNGTYFTNHDWLPAIGYQKNRELLDKRLRRKNGLSPRPEIPSLYNIDARNVIREHQINFEAIVITDEAQIAVAPGKLKQTWTKNGRKYLHYVADRPIKNGYAIYSSNYSVIDDVWQPSESLSRLLVNDSLEKVLIQVYRHPKHMENIEHVIQGVKASLSYYTKEFGKYPYSYIRIIEHPGNGFGMHAEATTIDHEEGFSLILPDSNSNSNSMKSFNLVFYLIAHEVAHQWWGASQLKPAFVEGAIVMSESLACYSGLKVMEETFGQDQLNKLLRMWRESYVMPRNRATVPLTHANDLFLGYRRGPMALYSLSRHIGTDKVNRALRELVEKHGSSEIPLPTTLDLYKELKEVTPDSLYYMLHDLFKKNTYWELQMENASAEQLKSGKWEVQLTLKARKVVVDTAGFETEISMDDWVEIGIIEEDEKDSELLYLKKHKVHTGVQKIKVEVPFRPAQAVVDPNYLLRDWEVENNMTDVRIMEI